MTELNDVYDKNRKKTGRVHRRGTAWRFGEYGLVVCVWIYDGKGRLLLTKRDPAKSFGDTWENTGGAVRAGEDSLQAIVREVYEETGLTVENPVLCGTKQFQTLGGARYVVFFYKADKFHGALKSSDEGEVYWLPRAELGNQKLAPDMMDMVKVMESDDLCEFFYEKIDGKWNFTLY